MRPADVGARDPSAAIRTALMADPAVRSVDLTGSRAAGTATELSDWDYVIASADPAGVAVRLPALIAELRPLAQLWDPLAASPVYMVVLPGAVKVDLFTASRARSSGPPGLREVDDHFWDWNLWLGGKRLRGQDELVAAELTKMWRYLLAPLGATTGPPRTQPQAVGVYLELRRRRELELSQAVSRVLGDAVMTRLRAADLL